MHVWGVAHIHACCVYIASAIWQTQRLSYSIVAGADRRTSCSSSPALTAAPAAFCVLLLLAHLTDMQELGLIGLRIQRMPCTMGVEFNNPATYPYLSVASPSCHDVTPLRAWCVWLLSWNGMMAQAPKAGGQEDVAWQPCYLPTPVHL